MENRSYYVGKNYPKYFLTPHWKELNYKLIDNNPKAKCWISGKTNSLLLHHESYDNLFREKLGKDIFILNYDIHNQLHFWRFLLFFHIKTPLVPKKLKRRRLYLKLIFCIRNRKLFLTMWYLLIYIKSMLE